MLISLFVVLVTTQSVYSDGWSTIVYNENINFELETTSLEVKTQAFADKVLATTILGFRDANNENAGGIKLEFQEDKKRVAYAIRGCKGVGQFANPPTYDKEIIWRITKIKAGSDDITVKIHSDDKEMVNVKLTNKECPDLDLKIWNRDVTAIEFIKVSGVKPETGYRAHNPEAKGEEQSDCAKTFSCSGGFVPLISPALIGILTVIFG